MEKLYYISQGTSIEKHLENIQNACEAGIGLIQLRLKNVSQDDYNMASKKAVMICENNGAKLIVNDNVAASIASNAHGIHLGKKDEAPSVVRTQFPNKIIGGTANTIEDCLRLVEEKVDYIGLGPFHFTTTKSGLDPIVSAEEYSFITKMLKGKGIKLPVYAIGGIEQKDVEPALNTGVYGVCMSGYLTQKEDLQERVLQIKSDLK